MEKTWIEWNSSSICYTSRWLSYKLWDFFLLPASFVQSTRVDSAVGFWRVLPIMVKLNVGRKPERRAQRGKIRNEKRKVASSKLRRPARKEGKGKRETIFHDIYHSESNDDDEEEGAEKNYVNWIFFPRLLSTWLCFCVCECANVMFAERTLRTLGKLGNVRWS